QGHRPHLSAGGIREADDLKELHRPTKALSKARSSDCLSSSGRLADLQPFPTRMAAIRDAEFEGCSWRYGRISCSRNANAARPARRNREDPGAAIGGSGPSRGGRAEEIEDEPGYIVPFLSRWRAQ